MIARREFSQAFVIVIFVIVAGLGGGINFVLSQGYLSSVQASDLWGVETLLFLGYDATDNDFMIYHDGILSNPQSYWHGNKSQDGVNYGERIGVYVQNQGISTIIFKKIQLGNNVYSFQQMGPTFTMTPYSMDSPLDKGEYTIVATGNPSGPANIINGKIPVLYSGQIATIVFELEQNFNLNRDMPLQITTEAGGKYVYTIISGQRLN